VDLEDLLAPLRPRLGHLDEPVEPTRPENRLVEHIEPVRGRDDPHLAAVLEPVHLREQLHHRPLDLRVPGGFRVRPLGGDGVDLVDEDHCRLAFGGEFEQVTDEPRALADELPHQLRAGHLDERGVRLVGDRLRQHRLPGAGRAVQQNAARRFDSDLSELVGVHERVLDGLTNLSNLVGDPADVVVDDLRRAVDLHRLRTGVRLVVQHRLDREGVVDRDAVAGLQLVGEPCRHLRQHFLVVAVLFDNDTVVCHLVDGRDVQRGGLQRLVASFQLVDLLAEIGPPLFGVVEPVVKLFVHLDDPREVFPHRVEPFLLAHLRVEIQTRTLRERGTA